LKKLVAALLTGVILSSAAVTTASAEEHKVQKGENLWDIANEYNTSVDELVEINDLKTTVIQPKQILYINNTYVVQRGDTLLSISDEYDVTVDELKDWNELHTSLIVIGQELQIKGVNVDEKDSEQPEAVTTNTNSEKADTKTNTESAESDEVKVAAETTTNEAPQGKTFTVTATAYTAGCDGCTGITYTGVDLNKNPNAKVIAVDPSVIPLGSEVYVEGYGYAIAADIGSAIQGNRIDLHVPTKDEAFSWGVQDVNVTIVE
jgi:3D (Asp-Asp-Asp) domain-containing protein